MTGIQAALVVAQMVNARNADLKRYARLEYGTSETAWILASARLSKRSRPRRTLLARLLRTRSRAASASRAGDSSPA